MDTDVIIAIVATLVVGFALATLVLLVLFFRSRENRDWQADFLALQLENNRYLQKVHDENTRFFRSMGLTMQQILECVDRVD